MRSVLFTTLAACLSLAAGLGDSTFSPARPPAIPLAVKSPYMNAILQAGSNDEFGGGYLAGQWPRFWAGQIVGWAGFIRVDGTVKTFLGAPPGPELVTQTGFEYTSTTSKFMMTFDDLVKFNVTFLSPVTPTDFQRQSLVYSYMEVSVESMDGKAHDVQVYSDISAEWIAGDRDAIAQWNYSVVGDVAYHQIYRQNQILFSESSNQADWGNWYWATDNTDDLTYQSGSDTDVRGAFEKNGKLGNTNDTVFRAIAKDFPVFGLAHDLGSIKSATNVLYTLGLAQDVAVRFSGAGGVVSVPPLWKDYFATELDALKFAHSDYESVLKISSAFDNQVSIDSFAAGGQDYLTITSLSTRQTFGTVQLCGTKNQTYLFLKEISSGGVSQTVDVIFPAHPILMYTNPILLKLALDPIFENTEAGAWPQKFAMHDLGRYPNATGHPDGVAEAQPLEECGNMLIMTLAYAERADDIDYLKSHYDLLTQWTGFLIDEALIPASQISTDDFAGPLANQTNLALKGMIGIGAMAKIANLTGNTDDAKNFSSIAEDYISQWMTLGVAQDANPPHTTLGYGRNNTHGLLYNLYADRSLNLNLVPQSVYDMQSTFYASNFSKYGIPLDTRHEYTKSDWEMFTAAVASPSVQKEFITRLANWVNETSSNGAMTDLYDVETGGFGKGVTFSARPVVGGHFALLALKDVDTDGKWISPTAGPDSEEASKTTSATSSATGTETSPAAAASSSTDKASQATSEKKKEGDWKVALVIGGLGLICGFIFL